MAKFIRRCICKAEIPDDKDWCESCAPFFGTTRDLTLEDYVKEDKEETQ